MNRTGTVSRRKSMGELYEEEVTQREGRRRGGHKGKNTSTKWGRSLPLFMVCPCNPARPLHESHPSGPESRKRLFGDSGPAG